METGANFSWNLLRSLFELVTDCGRTGSVAEVLPDLSDIIENQQVKES